MPRVGLKCTSLELCWQLFGSFCRNLIKTRLVCSCRSDDGAALELFRAHVCSYEIFRSTICTMTWEGFIKSSFISVAPRRIPGFSADKVFSLASRFISVFCAAKPLIALSASREILAGIPSFGFAFHVCLAILNCSTTKCTKFFCHKASCLMHTNFAFGKVFTFFMLFHFLRLA